MEVVTLEDKAREVRAGVIDSILHSPKNQELFHHGREELEAMSPGELHELSVRAGLGPPPSMSSHSAASQGHGPRTQAERNLVYLHAKGVRKILAHPRNTRPAEELEGLSYSQLRAYAWDALRLRLRNLMMGAADFSAREVDIEAEEQERAARLGIHPDEIGG